MMMMTFMLSFLPLPVQRLAIPGFNIGRRAGSGLEDILVQPEGNLTLQEAHQRRSPWYLHSRTQKESLRVLRSFSFAALSSG